MSETVELLEIMVVFIRIWETKPFKHEMVNYHFKIVWVGVQPVHYKDWLPLSLKTDILQGDIDGEFRHHFLYFVVHTFLEVEYVLYCHM